MQPNPNPITPDTSTPNLTPAPAEPTVTLDRETLHLVISSLRQARHLADDEDISELTWGDRLEIVALIDEALRPLRARARELAARLEGRAA